MGRAVPLLASRPQPLARGSQFPVSHPYRDAILPTACRSLSVPVMHGQPGPISGCCAHQKKQTTQMA